MRGCLEEAWSERSGPTNRNRIRGGAFRGERAHDREAPATKGRRRRSGGRAPKADVLTWGDLALRLKGRPRRKAEREVSRGHSIPPEAGEGLNGRETPPEGGGPCVSMGDGLRRPGNWSCRSGDRVKPGAQDGARNPRRRRMETRARAQCTRDLNLPNRRLRTRMSGGVGGERRRFCRRPLSRSCRCGAHAAPAASCPPRAAPAFSEATAAPGGRAQHRCGLCSGRCPHRPAGQGPGLASAGGPCIGRWAAGS